MLEVAVEALELVARRRALDPHDRFGHVLLQFLLRAHRPHKYRDNLPPLDQADDELVGIDPAIAAAALRAAREASDGITSSKPGPDPRDNAADAGSPMGLGQ
jgi:hypothetical protein